LLGGSVPAVPYQKQEGYEGGGRAAKPQSGGA